MHECVHAGLGQGAELEVGKGRGRRLGYGMEREGWLIGPSNAREPESGVTLLGDIVEGCYDCLKPLLCYLVWGAEQSPSEV